MKKLLFLILFLPLVVIAQVEVTKDYAGMISGASYQLDSAETPSFTNVRVGAEAVWAVNPKFEIKSFGVYQTPNTFIHSFLEFIVLIQVGSLKEGKLQPLWDIIVHTLFLLVLILNRGV
jgi:hypothetical protein